LTVGLYSEGDYFGYVALLENSVYRESAEAMEDAEVALIPREDFEGLINNNSEVTRKFIKLLAHNVVERGRTITRSCI
jgi:CRP-like cAMP-binding protein